MSIEISTKLQDIIYESQSLNSVHKAIQICTDNNLKKIFQRAFDNEKINKIFSEMLFDSILKGNDIPKISDVKRIYYTNKNIKYIYIKSI